MGEIKVGSTDILEIYVGTTPVPEVYVGSTLIWSSGASTFTVSANFNTLSNSGGLGASVSFSYGVSDFSLTSQPSWVSSVTQTTSGGKTTGFTFDYDPNAGTSTRTGSITFFAAGASRSVSLTQAGTAVVSVTGVTLNTWSLNLTVGQTQTLTATVSPSNATNKAVTWSSSNTSVATVSQSGEVTAIANGTATITVTTQDGGYTDTCDATVAALTLSASPESLTFDYGDSGSSAKKSIAITTNQSWSAVASTGFEIYGPTSGTGDYTIQVYPTSSNTGQTDKTGSVTITAANNVSKTVGIVHYAQSYSLSVTPTSMEFDYDDNTYYEGQDVTITADHAWTATISSGFGIGSNGSSTASGSAGTTTLRIYPTSNNTGTASRTGTFEVTGTASGFVRSVSLTQAVNPSIYVTVTDALSFTGTGSTETITITGTVSSWQITSAPSWCSYASASGTSSTIAITAGANSTGDARIGEITLTINGVSGYIVSVDQPDASAVNYTFSISATPSDAIVTINSVQRTSYSCPAGTSITWSVAKSGYVTQSGTYTMGAADHTETVSLAVDYTLSVSPTSLSFAYDTYSSETYADIGESIYIGGNDTWSLTMPSWCKSYGNTTSGTAPQYIRVYPNSANSGSSARTGVITITGAHGQTATVSVTQNYDTDALQSISIDGPDTLDVNDASSYIEVYTPTDTTETGVTWSITSGSSYCTGTVEDVGGGGDSFVLRPTSSAYVGATITIRATSTVNSSIYATKTITIVDELGPVDLPESVEIDYSDFAYNAGSYVYMGSSYQMQATVYPTTASQDVTWSLSKTNGGAWTDTSKVSITSSGLLTINASSWTQVKVVATCVEDNSITDSLNMLVNSGT